MNNIRNLTKEKLNEFLINNNQQKYRTKQIFNWLHNKFIIDLNQMSNVSSELINILRNNFDDSLPKIIDKFISKLDGSIKYLIKLKDNNIIETVLLKYKYGYSICISSQVGCNMGCAFCASTINGLVRNLDTFELLSQIYLVNKDLVNDKISHIVIMGSGEPLNNLENIIDFFKIINDEDGLNISLRSITISTCGIVDKINELSNYNLPITLALSLHSSNDEIRKKIMPIAKKYKLNDVLNAMASYYQKTKRKITLEYILIDNINSSIDNAKELYSLLYEEFIIKEVQFNINLIPINPVNENDFKRPSKTKIDDFYKYLLNNKIDINIRREIGSDISGSCGQLRSKYLKG